MKLTPSLIKKNEAVEINRIYQFRYKCYSIDTDWRPKNDIGMDYDIYDENAIHLVMYMPGQELILSSGNKYVTREIATYHRIIPRLSKTGQSNTFLIENEYENAMSSNKISIVNTPEVGEISRLCIHKNKVRDMLRTKNLKQNFMMSQYRFTYQACMFFGIKHLYFASTRHIIENGRKRGFPIHRMMPLVKLKNGDEIEFVQMHWDEFNDRAPDEVVEWFNTPYEDCPFENFRQESLKTVKHVS